MSGHSVGHLTVVAVPAFAPSTVVAVETGTSPTDSPEPENLSSVESGVPPAQYVSYENRAKALPFLYSGTCAAESDF